MKPKMFPLISVIMPVFNGEKFLKKAIQSIIDQTYTTFNLIIINDGSTDQTEEIILSFNDSRITYIKNEHNLKLIRTLNKGLDLATGKYIARMDADDISMPCRFEKQIAFLENNLDCGVCGTWAKCINSEGKQTGRIKNPTSNEMIRVSLMFTSPLIHPTIMIRSEIAKALKYREEAIHAEDYDLWCRIANEQRYKIENLPSYLLLYRWHDMNMSVEHTDKQQKTKRDLIKIQIEKLIPNVDEINLDSHLLSFSLFRFGKKLQINIKTVENAKHWLENLSIKNLKNQVYNQTALDAFLLSRWFIICLYKKSFMQVFSMKTHYYKPVVLYSALKLLLSK